MFSTYPESLVVAGDNTVLFAAQPAMALAVVISVIHAAIAAANHAAYDFFVASETFLTRHENSWDVFVYQRSFFTEAIRYGNEYVFERLAQLCVRTDGCGPHDIQCQFVPSIEAGCMFAFNYLFNHPCFAEFAAEDHRQEFIVRGLCIAMAKRLDNVVERLMPLVRVFDAEVVRSAVLHMPEMLNRIMTDARLTIRGWECVTSWVGGNSALLRPLFDQPIFAADSRARSEALYVAILNMNKKQSDANKEFFLWCLERGDMKLDLRSAKIHFANCNHKWSSDRLRYVLRKLVDQNCFVMTVPFLSAVVRDRRWSTLSIAMSLCDPTIEHFALADDVLSLRGASRIRALDILGSHPRVQTLLAPVAGNTIFKKMSNYRRAILNPNDSDQPLAEFENLTIA